MSFCFTGNQIAGLFLKKNRNSLQIKILKRKEQVTISSELSTINAMTSQIIQVPNYQLYTMDILLIICKL